MTTREFWAIVTITLLPLIPAILLFRVLPSKAAVRGPFRGLNINLSGSFGAYFVLLLLLLGAFRSMISEREFEVWELRGKLLFKDGLGDPAAVTLLLDPPNYSKQKDGTFRVTIVRSPVRTGELEFPSLVLEAQGYMPRTVELESEGKRNEARQVINIGEVQLEQVPPRLAPYSEGSLTSLVPEEPQ